MNKQIFTISGWILLLGMVVLRIMFGYTDWQLVILPLAFLSFSIGNGKINKLKRLSFFQISFIIISLLISVAIAFGLIQLANYLINVVFNLEGQVKTISEWSSIIIALIPAFIIFGSVINKVDDNLKEQ